MGNEDFLYASEETAAETEGHTEVRYRLEGNTSQVDAVPAANRHLRNRGGGGQKGVALVGDAVLTVKEGAAVAMAREVIADAEARHRTELAGLNMLQLTEGLERRCRGRLVTPAQVGAEIARLQNVAIYGDSVRRR